MLYCDTSALIKLYIEEKSSGELKAAIIEAEAVAVCRIAWAEAHAALSRRAREMPDDTAVIEQAKIAFNIDWPRFVIIEITQTLVEHAGDFADVFALHGYDSVQLAAAFEANRIAQIPIDFACFDHRLNKAASVLGMMVVFP
jgi:predicted nucleic acid-binding protein